MFRCISLDDRFLTVCKSHFLYGTWYDGFELRDDLMSTPDIVLTSMQSEDIDKSSLTGVVVCVFDGTDLLCGLRAF